MRPLNSQFLYARALDDAVRSARRWLDLGCGHAFLPPFASGSVELPPSGCRVIGVDLDPVAIRAHAHLHLRIIGSVESLPVRSASADLVTANMVLEHVEHPETLFTEVERVLEPGGSFLMHTPNLSGYTTFLTRLVPERVRPRLANLLQGRNEADVYPTFYRANTVDVLRTAAEEAGLAVADLRTVESSAQLYKVPVVGSLEELWLRLLRWDRLAARRPCIIGRFRKERQHPRG